MSAPTASLTTAWAPAKINLYLHVGPVQADGYHPLDSLVQFADVKAADRITARPARDLSLVVEGPNGKPLKGEKDNLVLRAANLLREASGRTGLGAALHLYKELPVASGIGGGSADAAATLLVLNQYWDIGFSEEGLQTLAAELGSDVPACLTGRPAVMRGRGEELTEVDMLDLPVVLVNPGVKLSTAAVYKRFDKMGLGKEFEMREPPGFADDGHGPAVFARTLQRYSNDLEAPAIAMCSAIGDVLKELDDSGAHLARLSGSGATCFGIFETEDEASAAAYALSKKRRKWWVRAVTLQGRDRRLS